MDEKGKVLTRTEYLPFGETWFSEGDQGNKPKFNSQELDEETNFYFYNTRYYDPQIARFVTADNVIDGEMNTQGWNRFSYVQNNPIMYKDPTGHVIETAWDFLSLGLSCKSLYDAVKKGDAMDITLAASAVVLDTAAVLLPGIPGGAGAALKAVKYSKVGVDAAIAAKEEYDSSGDLVKAGGMGMLNAVTSIGIDKGIDKVSKLKPVEKALNNIKDSVHDFDTRNPLRWESRWHKESNKIPEFLTKGVKTGIKKSRDIMIDNAKAPREGGGGGWGEKMDKSKQPTPIRLNKKPTAIA